LSKILFTGGRAPVTLHLARLFHAAGHTVFVADCLSTQLCSTSNAVRRCFEVPAPNSDPVGFLAGLSGIVRSESIDVLVPTCEEVFHLARGRALIPCPVFAPDWSRLQRLHSKWDFNQDLIALGKPVPRTWLLQSVDDLSA
jgi:predicted ATP-grasp superfamily ATP-dependent carboligase